MKTIELYAGTKSFSKVAAALGHQTFSTDYEEIDGQDLVADIRTLNAKDFPYQPDILWSSPPCEGFSVASIGANWGGGGETLHTQERHRVSFDGLSEPRPEIDSNARAKVVVYRESPRRFEEPSFATRCTIHAYDLVLPVWGYSSEANKHLDERTVVCAKASMSQLPLRQGGKYSRPTLPSRSRTPGCQNRHTGIGGVQGSIQDPGSTF